MATINLKDENPINVNISSEETLNTKIKDLNYIPEYKQYELERQNNEVERQSNESERQNNEISRETYISELKQRVLSGEFNGVGISNITKTSTSGLVDTYTITYDDGKTETFNVTNGAKGEKGDKGDKGDQGIQGEQGIQGIQGIQGDKGEKGDTGSQGIQGEKGDRGDQGIQGDKGDKGDKGETGDKGDKGEKGDKGNPFTYDDFTPEQLASLKGSKGDKGEQGEPGTPGNDGVSPTITTSKTGKVTTITMVDVLGTHTATINDGADGQGSGDMLTTTYDTNGNGIVDNAEKVNNHTVESDVPSNAVFTDTTYTAGTGIEITDGVISNTQTSANWGNITGTLSEQTDLNNALNNKVDKITGKGLSTNDYTTEEKNKLTSLANVKEIGTGLSLDTGGKLSNTRPNPTWGNIAGTLSQQSDLNNVLNNKADSTHTHTTADITNFPTIPSDLSDLTDSTNILTGKQDVLTAGENITIENNVISSTGGADVIIIYSDDSDADTIAKLNLIAGEDGGWTGKDAIYVDYMVNHTDIYVLSVVNLVGVTRLYGFTGGTAGMCVINLYSNGTIAKIAQSFTEIFEMVSNKVTSISSSSTDTQYPSAKCVYDSQKIISDKLTASTTYSTEETVIGTFNGKPLYRKMYSVGESTSQTISYSASSSPTYSDTIVNRYGYIKYEKKMNEYTAYVGDDEYKVSVDQDGINITLDSAMTPDTGTGYLIIEYTKSADSTSS